MTNHSAQVCVLDFPPQLTIEAHQQEFFRVAARMAYLILCKMHVYMISMLTLMVLISVKVFGTLLLLSISPYIDMNCGARMV